MVIRNVPTTQFEGEQWDQPGKGLVKSNKDMRPEILVRGFTIEKPFLLSTSFLFSHFHHRAFLKAQSTIFTKLFAFSIRIKCMDIGFLHLSLVDHFYDLAYS
jgi:hypothetical protein